MKFPITREILQTYDYNKLQQEQEEEEFQKHISRNLEIVCKEFERMFQGSCREKQFVWRGIQNINYHPKYHIFNEKYRDRALLEFIEKLKELFIGCDIIIDPLKTYLIINWS
jgi:hypothetical protein